jgi:hypothetical protein
MNVGDTFTHNGVTYKVINILENGDVEGRSYALSTGPGTPPYLEIQIAPGDISG